MKRFLSFFLSVLLILTLFSSCELANILSGAPESTYSIQDIISLSDLPAYNGSPYIDVNRNQPAFEESDLTTDAFEHYSSLDSLGRCGVAYANVCTDLMPTEERGNISSVKPTGWQTVKYDCVDEKSLYNRCHLIGFQLTAENANQKNLITGTRYLNVEGMLPFENMVADYVKETENHVLYRVTPVFSGNNLLADGVLMEAMSVEDRGEGILFCVYCYNVQPGVTISYADGSSHLSAEPESSEDTADTEVHQYVLNKNSKKFHNPDCSGAASISPKNREDYTGTRQELLNQGYSPCKTCNP